MVTLTEWFRPTSIGKNDSQHLFKTIISNHPVYAIKTNMAAQQILLFIMCTDNTALSEADVKEGWIYPVR